MKIAKKDILETISTCSRANPDVSGVEVRQVLLERFGAKGGTGRIYRLVEQFKREQDEDRKAELINQIETFKIKLEEAEERVTQALKRAELAEHREQVHFDRVASEMHELRQFRAQYEGLGGVKRAAAVETDRLQLLMQNTRSRQHIAMLEALLVSNGIELPKDSE